MLDFFYVFSGRGGFCFSRSLGGDAVTGGPWTLDGIALADGRNILVLFFARADERVTRLTNFAGARIAGCFRHLNAVGLRFLKFSRSLIVDRLGLN